MSYAHKTLPRFATQFHPEHYYDTQHPNDNDSINHQRAWIENFLHFSKLYHNHVHNNATSPEKFLTLIYATLNQCMNHEQCPMEDMVEELLAKYWVE